MSQVIGETITDEEGNLVQYAVDDQEHHEDHHRPAGQRY